MAKFIPPGQIEISGSESGTFWGACEFKAGQWRGRNELGKIWMALREAMR